MFDVFEIFNLKSLYCQNFNFIKILISDLELAFFIFGDLDVLFSFRLDGYVSIA